MLRINTLCWLGYHKFNKAYCQRCGLDREAVKTAIFTPDQPVGTTQFIESISDKEKFKNANNIGDLTRNE